MKKGIIKPRSPNCTPTCQHPAAPSWVAEVRLPHHASQRLPESRRPPGAWVHVGTMLRNTSPTCMTTMSRWGHRVPGAPTSPSHGFLLLTYRHAHAFILLELSSVVISSVLQTCETSVPVRTAGPNTRGTTSTFTRSPGREF